MCWALSVFDSGDICPAMSSHLCWQLHEFLGRFKISIYTVTVTKRRGCGVREAGEQGDLKESVLRLRGDLGWGCAGGVWVTGKWWREEARTYYRKGRWRYISFIFNCLWHKISYFSIMFFQFPAFISWRDLVKYTLTKLTIIMFHRIH